MALIKVHLLALRRLVSRQVTGTLVLLSYWRQSVNQMVRIHHVTDGHLLSMRTGVK